MHGLKFKFCDAAETQNDSCPSSDGDGLDQILLKAKKGQNIYTTGEQTKMVIMPLSSLVV